MLREPWHMQTRKVHMVQYMEAHVTATRACQTRFVVPPLLPCSEMYVINRSLLT